MYKESDVQMNAALGNPEQTHNKDHYYWPKDGMAVKAPPWMQNWQKKKSETIYIYVYPHLKSYRAVPHSGLYMQWVTTKGGTCMEISKILAPSPKWVEWVETCQLQMKRKKPLLLADLENNALLFWLCAFQVDC